MNCHAPNVSTDMAERYLATTREKKGRIKVTLKDAVQD